MEASGAVIDAVRAEIRARQERGETWYVEYTRPMKAKRTKAGQVTRTLTDAATGTLAVSHQARVVYRNHPGLSSGHYVHEPIAPVSITRDDTSTTTAAAVWAALDGLAPA